MKVKFTVEAENERDLRIYTQATAMYSVLWDLDQHLRNTMKYDEALDKNKYRAYEEIREKLHELLNDDGIKLDL